MQANALIRCQNDVLYCSTNSEIFSEKARSIADLWLNLCRPIRRMPYVLRKDECERERQPRGEREREREREREGGRERNKCISPLPKRCACSSAPVKTTEIFTTRKLILHPCQTSFDTVCWPFNVSYNKH